MNHKAIRWRITSWRNRAVVAEELADVGELPAARGYAEALRECADQLELSLTRATQRERPASEH